MLAENSPEEELPEDDEFDGRILVVVDDKWKMYFDGAINLSGSGTGVVLISPDGQHYPVAGKLTFPCTNNVFEYEACILGVQLAISMKIKKLQVYGDSPLIILQTAGEWRTRDTKLIPYHEFLGELIKEFEEITFDYLPRAQNHFADALATLSAMLQVTDGLDIEPLKIDILERQTCCAAIEEGFDEEPWYHDIKNYLQNGEFPEGIQMADRKYIAKVAAKFFLIGQTLYKRSFDTTLLRCVDAKEAERLMKEIHEGECGPHMNGHMLARKIMRLGYYWMTMETDCIQHVHCCHQCQIYANQVNVPPNELHQMTEPWPFSMWGIDIIGPINPKASNGHHFILVAIDYFSKWIEANSYVNVTTKNVAKFIKRDINSRYGVPEAIITDNGSNLNNMIVDGLLEEFKIKHLRSSPYRPHMNGAVEAANKNIKNILSKTVENYRDWHERLHFALMAYRTSIRTSTGTTSYSLVYGAEAVLPIEIEIASLRVLSQVGLSKDDWIRQRFENLNVIDEKRLKAICHGQAYKKRVARSFNKKVKPRYFQAEDIVVKKILQNHTDPRGKFTPNYEGPYIVKKVIPGGALILVQMDGNE